jgi:AraC-like DNA-binding protein
VSEKDSLADRFLFNKVKEAEDFLSVLSAMIYWTFGLVSIIRYRRWLYNNTSNTLYPTYEWLRNVIVLLGVFFLILGINIILDYGFDYGVTHFVHWQILFVYLAVLIYYLGFRGYQVPGIEIALAEDIPGTSLEGADTPFESVASFSSFPTANLVTEMPVKDRKYSSTGLTILKILVEEKLYLDPEFSLQTLAHKLKMSPVAVSRVINSELKKNFRNLVNGYRVEEVKTRLNDPRSIQLSLLGIAYECGFNSEASFYRIFKNVVGVSPKEYLLRQQNQ